MLPFLYGFAIFFQPGIFFPALEPFKPIFSLTLLCIVAAMGFKPGYPRANAFQQTAFVLLCCFLMIQVISVYPMGLSYMTTEFLYWYQYAAVMVAAILVMSNLENICKFVWGVVMGGSFIVGFGIYAVIMELPNAHGGKAGAYGMYENHNDYTFMILLILPFIYALWRYGRGMLRHVLLITLLIMCIVGVLLSLSRGGMLVLVVQAGLIIMLTVPKQKRIPLIIALAVVGAVGISYQWAKRSEVQTIYTLQDSKASRLELWTAGLNMFKANPFLGTGARRFALDANDYGTISSDNFGKNAHNTYIQILATSGALGFFAFIGFLYYHIRGLGWTSLAVIHHRADALRVATLISLISIGLRALLDAKSHDWSFYILCAIGVALLALRSEQRQVRQPLVSRRPSTRKRATDPIPSSASGGKVKIPRRPSRKAVQTPDAGSE